jgi:hypothetical protein
MVKFKVLGGQFKYNGKIYKMGETLVSPLNLDKTFPKHFARVEAEQPRTILAAERPRGRTRKPTVVPPPSSVPALSPTANDEPSIDGDVGVDVTADFEEAVKSGLVVKRKGDVFFVHDADDPTPLNPTGLRENQVGAFCEKSS